MPLLKRSLAKACVGLRGGNDADIQAMKGILALSVAVGCPRLWLAWEELLHRRKQLRQPLEVTLKAVERLAGRGQGTTIASEHHETTSLERDGGPSASPSALGANDDDHRDQERSAELE